jgi:hypothetical protein
LLYRPETKPHVSYEMVKNQLDAPVICRETNGLLLGFFALRWRAGCFLPRDRRCVDADLTLHPDQSVLGWGMLKKEIDWELLIYMGATLSIPLF